MIHAMLSGTLSADPVERSSSKGNRYVTATLRVAAGPESVFVGVAAFDTTAADRLTAMRKGAGISITGELQLNPWTDRDGVEHRDWRVIANEVLSVSQAARRRRAIGDGE